MPYQVNLPGIREASLDAIRSCMTNNLDALNAALTGVVPPLALGVTVQPTQFLIGDPYTVPKVDTNPFWITVLGGGDRDGTDSEQELYYIDPGFHITLHTNIYVYIHPDSFPNIDPFLQEELRERLLTRLVDWLTVDVFNKKGNPANPNLIDAGIIIPLGSRVFSVDPAFDTMDRGTVSTVRMGSITKSYAQTMQIRSAELHHIAHVYGGT